MSNLPIPTADTAISGLHQIDTPLTIDDLLIISIKLTAGYYTGKITLEQIKTSFLNNTQALENSGLSTLLDGKANASHKHKAIDITDLDLILLDKANSIHTHTTGQISGLATLLSEKANLIHVHEMTAISGLLSALASKSNLIHTHAITDVVGLKQRLDSLEEWTIGGGSNHTHQIEQVVGLRSALDNKSDVQHAHDISAISGLEDALNQKSNNGHVHSTADISDFSESLDNKANTVHEHAVSDIAGLEQRLADKSDVNHEHPIDDIVGLGEALDNKAPNQHVQPISSITGLELALEDKSALFHNHQPSEIDGLEEELFKKANTEHTHSASDIVDLNNVLSSKANTEHTHAISNVVGLRTELDGTEKASNKTGSMGNTNPLAYPTVAGVKTWLDETLRSYNYPVMSVNGRFGSIELSQRDVGLEYVNNTADTDKPISTATQQGLELKVDKKLARFDSELGFGRVLNGDDYLIVIAKLQKQIDILMGIEPRPDDNGVAVSVVDRKLTFTFEKEVRFNNTPLVNLVVTPSELFGALFKEDVSNGIVANRNFIENILIETTSKTISLSLLDNWINSFPIKQMDSLDNEKAGVGIISSELNAIYKAFTSEDGGLVVPSNTDTIPLLTYTNLSQFGLPHDDSIYDASTLLGVWGTVPLYSSSSNNPIVDIIVGANSLSLVFGRDVLINGTLLEAYAGTASELFSVLFEEGLNFDWAAIVDESKVKLKVFKNFLGIELEPNWFNLDELIALDLDMDGKVGLDLTIDTSIFETVTGEDLVVSRSPAVKLNTYANSSIYLDLFDVDDYLEAEFVSTWDGEISYKNITPSTVKTGEATFNIIKPVTNLVGVYNA